jgi:ferritin-like metal-binding protein YciE
MKNTDTKLVQKKLTIDVEKTRTNTEQGLCDLFIDELKDIYWTEKALVQALPNMIKHSGEDELVIALSGHFEITKKHITRLEEVFSTIGKKAEAIRCEAMTGLIKEAEQIIHRTKKGMVRDAGIISVGQKVEHYKIASYGTLLFFAQKLGEKEAAILLKKTLDEEKYADDKLSEIAEISIHFEIMD